MSDSKTYIPAHLASAGFIPTDAEMNIINAAVAAVKVDHAPSDPTRWGNAKYEKDVLYERGRDAGQKPAQLVSVNDHLITVSSDLSPAEVEMATATILYAQHVVQGYCTYPVSQNGLGWSREKFFNSNTRNTPEFFSAVRFAIGTWLPWVDKPGEFNVAYHDQQHSGSIDIMGIVTEILKAVASPGTAEMLAKGAAAIASGDMNTSKVDSVGTFFWNSKSHTESHCQFTGTAAVKTVNYGVDYSYLLVYESITQESWRALFVQSNYEEFTFSANALQLRMYLSQWLQVTSSGQTVRELILDKLGALFHDQIVGAPFGS